MGDIIKDMSGGAGWAHLRTARREGKVRGDQVLLVVVCSSRRRKRSLGSTSEETLANQHPSKEHYQG